MPSITIDNFQFVLKKKYILGDRTFIHITSYEYTLPFLSCLTQLCPSSLSKSFDFVVFLQNGMWKVTYINPRARPPITKFTECTNNMGDVGHYTQGGWVHLDLQNFININFDNIGIDLSDIPLDNYKYNELYRLIPQGNENEIKDIICDSNVNDPYVDVLGYSYNYCRGINHHFIEEYIAYIQTVASSSGILKEPPVIDFIESLQMLKIKMDPALQTVLATITSEEMGWIKMDNTRRVFEGKVEYDPFFNIEFMNEFVNCIKIYFDAIFVKVEEESVNMTFHQRDKKNEYYSLRENIKK